MALPEPLTPQDCDLRDFDGFMLNVERLLASELWALSTPEEFKAAFALWCRSWKQVPCASLPDDDAVLAAYSGAGKRWPKVRKMALRGFVKCLDGRLYHSTLAQDALRAMKVKRQRSDAAHKRWDGKSASSSDRKQPTSRNAAASPPHPKSHDIPHNRPQSGSNASSVQFSTEPNPQKLEPASPPETPLDRLMVAMKLDHKTLHRRPSFREFPALFQEWKAQGCDPERDIWPTIERIAARKTDIGSPKFFEAAVLRARDDRTAAEPTEAERWAERVAAYRSEKFWSPTWGPTPDEPGCLAPTDLVAQGRAA